jgi:hypothetical protein
MERPYNARFCPNLYWYRYNSPRSVEALKERRLTLTEH